MQIEVAGMAASMTSLEAFKLAAVRLRSAWMASACASALVAQVELARQAASCADKSALVARLADVMLLHSTMASEASSTKEIVAAGSVQVPVMGGEMGLFLASSRRRATSARSHTR